jgi:hypothetical protein
LDLDLDILQAAKELAAAKGPRWGRWSLNSRARRSSPRAARVRNGFRFYLAVRAARETTMKQVNDLRDDG